MLSSRAAFIERDNVENLSKEMHTVKTLFKHSEVDKKCDKIVYLFLRALSF